MTQVWEKLARQHSDVKDRNILDLFKNDQRPAQFSVKSAGLLFDYSKTNIDAVTKDLLLALTSGVAQARDAMFSGPRSTKPKAARCCTRPCARPKARR